MKKKLASILITNFNKDKYLNSAVRSCLAQNYKKKEILIFDAKSTDNSLNILKKYKKIKVFINKKKKFATGPLSQINGIKELFKKSKGKVIFLLDSENPKFGISSFVSLKIVFGLYFLHISATSLTVTVSLVKLKIS